MERKVGGRFHLKLNIGSRPIGNKYHEGKVKRTLKRELKVPEIAEREPNRTSPAWSDCWRAGFPVVAAQRKRAVAARLLVPSVSQPCLSTSALGRGKPLADGKPPSGPNTAGGDSSQG